MECVKEVGSPWLFSWVLLEAAGFQQFPGWVTRIQPMHTQASLCTDPKAYLSTEARQQTPPKARWFSLTTPRGPT
jgi:hypothetical protein